MANFLHGKKLLIVEDEELLAMAVEDGVLYAGAASVEIAGTVAQALDALSAHSFDLAIVDVSLRGQHSWPVAEELRRRNVPYLTVTGYGDMLDHELVDKLLTKPYSIDDLLEALADLRTHAPSASNPAPPANPGA
ncbi:response regulator [Lysobacter capsici]|uniref:response regulator n=1 Tax=Lysobacter capsici TaxID=435897 RepID=UPI000BBAF36C|nr:response regulator [Lysobacter capsici]ATE74228.1 hypothetical protein CNO08_24430 [Lysobacter capsici]